MNSDKENIKKWLTLIILTILIYTAFQNISIIFEYIGLAFSIAVPFFICGAIAFVLNVPMKSIEKRLFGSKYLNGKLPNKIVRILSLFISIILLILIISGVVNIVVPQLVVTFYSVKNNVYAFMPKAIEFFKSVVKSDDAAKYIEELRNLDWQTIFNYIGDFLKSGGSVLNSTIGVVSTIFSTTVNIVIGFIFAIYILLQKEKLSVQATKVLFAFLPKEKGEKVISVAKLSYKTFSSFVTGQCLEACILGFMFFIVLSICGMPYSLLIGVLIAFTALIPIVGAFIGCFISALLILMISPIQALVFVIIFLIIQQIEGNLIYPHVVGSSVGLPSIWVLVAVTLGGNLFGVIGMLVFIPLSSILYTLFRQWVHKRLEKNDVDINKYIDS